MAGRMRFVGRNRGLVPLVAMTAMAAAVLGLSGPSAADVTAVRGEAYGYFASISLFGGPANVRGPAPIVTLPPAGSAVPLTANVASALVQFGPAILFSSGPITVSTQGTLGPGGSVTSSSSIQNVNTSGQEVFTATSISSTCTASETGVSGSTTVVNGTLETSQGNPDVTGDEVIVQVPTNPAPNTTYNGVIESVGDSFQAIFNEQIVNPNGSITVYAYHLRLLGPTAVGDLFVGKSECGVTATQTTTTVAPTTTTVAPTTTTVAPTTTTTVAPTTTTTVAPTTTTTVAPTTTTVAPTTTTVAPTTTTTTRPSTTTTVAPTTTTRAPTTTTVAPTTTTTTPTAAACKPGWGFGDKNHCHSGPPGLQRTVASVRDPNAGGGALVLIAIVLGLLAIARPRRS